MAIAASVSIRPKMAAESRACCDHDHPQARGIPEKSALYPTLPSMMDYDLSNISAAEYSQPDYSQFDLVKATQYGIFDRCLELVEKEGVDVRQTDKENVTALHWAAINNRLQIAELFLAHGADVNVKGGILNASPLHWAVRQGQFQMVILLMKHGADPLVQDIEGCACLHVAAQAGHVPIVAYLLAKGMDVDLLDRNGTTPLMWAAYRCFGPELTRLLLTMNASVNLADKSQQNTALHWAVLSNNHNVIRILARAGASLDAPNAQGQSPRDLAKLKKNGWIKHQLNFFAMEKGEGKPPIIQWLTRDKMFRRYILLGTPFFFLFSFGAAFEFPESSITTMFLIGFISLVVWYTAKTFSAYIHNESVLTYGVTLATKALLYWNMILIFWPYVNSFNMVTYFVVCTSGLFYYFFKAMKADPGYLKTNPNEQKKTIIELGEQNALDFNRFCSTCLIKKPVRSKHCSTCDRCVARFDHHCPWLENCVGCGNHHYFMGYIFFLFTMLLWYTFSGIVYWKKVCGPYSGGWWDAVRISAHCSPWLMWSYVNALFHVMWVGTLLVCQMYQAFWVGMTTNERLNLSRYTHMFNDMGQPQSPYSRGVLGNIADFFEVNICGLVKPVKVNWYQQYSHNLWQQQHQAV